MTTKLTREEHQKIKDIKILDLELCDYGHLNILNLGWEAWGKWFCEKHEREHVLCPSLCLPVSKNIIGCELIRRRTKRTEEPVKPNRPYDLTNCYLCFKELKGARYLLPTHQLTTKSDKNKQGTLSEHKQLQLITLNPKLFFHYPKFFFTPFS